MGFPKIWIEVPERIKPTANYFISLTDKLYDFTHVFSWAECAMETVSLLHLSF